MKSNSNMVPVVILTIVAAAGVYWYFFTGTGNELPLMESVAESRIQTKFQDLAGKLRLISFRADIFSDSRFNALADLTTPVSPESIGRIDPFAPLAGTSEN